MGQNRSVVQSRQAAVVRGSAAASVAIFAALAGHVSAGGAMPGMLGILVPWLLSLMVCVLLAGRRLSLWRMSLSVLVSQFLFHELFVLGAITPQGPPLQHVHGVQMTMPEGMFIPGAAMSDATMWLGHAIAAIATIAVLYRGERLVLALRDLARQSIHWLRERLAVAIPSVRPNTFVRPTLRTAAETLRSVLLLRVLRGRAPPRRLSI